MSDKLSTDPYKGVRDFYPEDMAIQRYIFDMWAEVVESYGFERYDASVLEPAELYRAKTGDEIVNEQTYTFRDRGDREVTLRPEMTPTVARMVAARRRELSFPLRWYSIPNLFRYERTQRGRLREHWQLNCDIFGVDNQYADAEIISLAYNILKKFGAKDADFVIKVNDRKARLAGIQENEPSPEQMHQIMKLLDKKDKMNSDAFQAETKKILDGVYELAFEETESTKKLIALLAEQGVTNVQFSDSLVRGFDYYDGIVFEVFDTAPENNRSLFGGGRYNNLTALFGGDPIPAVGFGMGDVTIRDFLETHNLLPAVRSSKHSLLTYGARVMLLLASPEVATRALNIREEIREHGVKVALDFSDKKLKDQIAQAGKQGVPYIIVVGEDELASGSYALRDMVSGEEVHGTIPELIERMK